MFGVGPCPFGNLGQCGISEINKKVTLPTTGKTNRNQYGKYENK